MHTDSLNNLSTAELKALMIAIGRRLDERRPGLLGYCDQLEYAAVIKAYEALVGQERRAA